MRRALEQSSVDRVFQDGKRHMQSSVCSTLAHADPIQTNIEDPHTDIRLFSNAKPITMSLTLQLDNTNHTRLDAEMHTGSTTGALGATTGLSCRHPRKRPVKKSGSAAVNAAPQLGSLQQAELCISTSKAT